VEKVVHLPFYKENPYNMLLANGLADEGFEVVGLENVGKSSRQLISRVGPARILHFHWIRMFSASRSRIVSVMRSLIFILVLAWFRAVGKKLVITLHNLVPHEYGRRRVDIWCRRQILKMFHRIVVHSQSALRQACETYGIDKKVIYIPHPNYSTWYENRVTRAQAREYFGLPRDAVVFLFFGRIRPYKQMAAISGIFSGHGMDNTVLIIAGRELKREKNSDPLFRGMENVIYHDHYIPDDLVQYYFGCADAVIHPTCAFSALTSGSAALSISMYTPLIAADHVPFRDLVEDGLGIYCDFSSPDSLKRAVREVLSWDMDEFRDRCDKYMTRTNVSRVASRHAGLYHSLLESSRENGTGSAG
jgi:glycosyltransferase involved in cell wall biosynthesis